MDEGCAARSREARSLDQLVVDMPHLSTMQRPRVMERSGVVQPGAGRAVQRPPGREEVIQLIELGRLELLADVDDDP